MREEYRCKNQQKILTYIENTDTIQHTKYSISIP